MHHIASDGWSMPVLVREVASLYKSYSENKPPELTPPEIQYADYAIWQRNYLKGEVLERKISYWKEKLEGVAALQLPTDKPRPAIQSTRGSASRFTIPKEISDQLQALSKEEGTTMFMTLLASLNILLQKYSGQEDICVGSPVANRTQAETEGLIGFFVNTLALRSEVKAEQSFKELLQQVKATTTGAYDHQDLPFEKVVEAVVKERDLSRPPLFQVLFVLQNTTGNPALELGGLELTGEATTSQTAKFELTFSINETATGLHCSIEYNTDLYKQSTIERMVGHYGELLQSIVSNPGEKVSKLQMLTKNEEEQLTKEFNDTSADYRKDKTITQLIEEQAQKTPNKTAVVYEDKALSYKELNEKSNQLANYLRKRGVGAETLVPVCVERSIDMLTSILGILKSGGAYVPIDPEYPQDRIAYMLEDTGAKLIVSSQASQNKLSQQQAAEIITIDTDWKEISKESKEDLNIEIAPTSLAYIIYTSGSTGKPKGVMIEHKNASAFIDWCHQEFREDTFEVLLAGTSMCFDLSVFEFFYPLTVGKRIRILENGLDISKHLSTETKILTNSVPTVIESLLKEEVDISNISSINMAGEPIPSFVHQNLDTERIAVRNLYGPTEDTTYSTIYHLHKEQPLLIGKPISNTFVRIINREDNLVPIGVPGEICLGGAGLARGYLNREELTSEKFALDLFEPEKKSRLYKTGDLGRWLEDGNIEYLGRLDNQVKIRGYRIELGEIENVIQQSGLVNQAIAIAHTNENGIKRLVGYIVPKNSFDKDALLTYLYGKLPEYMVPAIWIELESMPQTSNGKIDRKALPNPDVNAMMKDEYVAPKSEIEQNLAEIWKELLGIGRIGMEDNFFELGGDSILTIQVVSRARRLGYELQPKDIFIYQTIGRLTQVLGERSKVIISGEQGYLSGLSGLLPIQQWYLQSDPIEISHFNQSVFLKIDKAVEIPLLENAIEKILNHHDALRFRYFKSGGNWQQEYGNAQGKIIVENIHSLNGDRIPSVIKDLGDKHQQSLDIEKGDLLRVVLMKTPDKDNYNRLLIVIHHLAIDGISWRILMEDLEILLSGNNDLGYKSNSYREWFENLEKYSQSSKLLSQRKYWQKITESYYPIATDKKFSGSVAMRDTLIYTNSLSAQLTTQLVQEVPAAYHTEINDILLCALAITLCDWNKQDKVVIGLEGHGREEVGEKIDISRTVGWFTSLYPLLLEVKTRKKQADVLIKSVKEQLRQIPEKGLGYGILKYINKEESLQGGDPWEIIFNYLGQVDNVIKESKFFSAAGESAGSSRSGELEVREKLSVNSIIKKGELVVTWTYSNKHFNQETIERLSSDYISNLEWLISHCIDQQKIGVVHTPSDYGLGSEISFEELDQFLNEHS